MHSQNQKENLFSMIKKCHLQEVTMLNSNHPHLNLNFQPHHHFKQLTRALAQEVITHQLKIYTKPLNTHFRADLKK